MRARYVIAIIAIAILAVGAKLFVFPPKKAALTQAGLDIHQMHKDKKDIPIQEMSDMSLVFDHNK